MVCVVKMGTRAAIRKPNQQQSLLIATQLTNKQTTASWIQLTATQLHLQRPVSVLLSSYYLLLAFRETLLRLRNHWVEGQGAIAVLSTQYHGHDHDHEHKKQEHSRLIDWLDFDDRSYVFGLASFFSLLSTPTTLSSQHHNITMWIFDWCKYSLFLQMIYPLITCILTFNFWTPNPFSFYFHFYNYFLYSSRRISILRFME